MENRIIDTYIFVQHYDQKKIKNQRLKPFLSHVDMSYNKNLNSPN
jgi:hypothetical protein